jgi:tetraacyldisaccharide 4'-kinase
MIDWVKMHDQKKFSAMTPALAYLSFLYGAAVRLRVKAYPNTKKTSLPGFVVSLGNLTVGGTGKTPATIMLAEWAAAEGYRPAVLSRGYGGKRGKEVLEVSDGKNLFARPAEAGDEPYLMARKLPGIPIFVSPNRYRAGLMAHEQHGANFFILDDGFQHIALKRDLDVVLVDSSRPFGNGHLLPWGPLREPVDHLRRADAFILTRAKGNSGKTGSPAFEFLKRRFPGKPVFLSEHVPEKIVFPDEGKDYNITFLKGRRVVAFAGLARPNALRETLISLESEVVSFKAFKDHHVYTPDQIRQLIREKNRLGVDCLMTTEKDWVRIQGVVKECPDLAYLMIRFVIASESKDFFEMIKEKVQKSGVGRHPPIPPSRGD